MSPAVTSPSLFTVSESLLRLVVLAVEFEFHFLQVEDDVGHVLDDARAGWRTRVARR